MNYCDAHKAHEEKMNRNASDIQDIWKAIDHMKAWVIIGMGSLLLNIILVIGKYILEKLG